MKKFIITINREFGSLGRPIARRLAELLKVEYYDRDIVEATARKLDQPVSVISDEEERKASGFFSMLFPLGHDLDHQRTLFETQSSIIQKLAQRGSCIFVGRCADYVLRGYPNVLHIYIYASYADRLANCVGPLHMEKSVAKRMIAGVDKARASYHRFWTGYAANDPDHNHIIVNSALLEVEGTAQALAMIAHVCFDDEKETGEEKRCESHGAASEDSGA